MVGNVRFKRMREVQVNGCPTARPLHEPLMEYLGALCVAVNRGMDGGGGARAVGGHGCAEFTQKNNPAVYESERRL